MVAKHSYYRFTLLILAFLFTGIAGFGQAVNPEYAKKLSRMYKYTVPLMTPDDLAGRKKLGEKLLILDTRQEEEYETSHIEGATFVSFDDFKKKDWKDVDKNQTVVVYCSVGYRSERIGEDLKSLGFESVHNLYGGIFEWVNQGYPVINEAGETTQKVHTYNENWGQWLDKGEKVW